MCSNDSASNINPKVSRLKYQPISNQTTVSTPPAIALANPSVSPMPQSSQMLNASMESAYAQHPSPTPGAPSTSIGINPLATTNTMSNMLSTLPSVNLLSLDHYRFQLYNYAMAERLRCAHYQQPIGASDYSTVAASAMNSMGPYGPRLALSMSLFHNRVFQPEEPKPQHSYIGLIAIAILSSPETKLVLSDIYQYILDNYPYFRTRGPGWRNSIRHNLSLNDCFIKAGRSANGKGHYWAIHPANQEDFKKGDFRRRKAQRKVRKHMGLAVDDEGTDSPSPPPLSMTPPPMAGALHNLAWGITDAMSSSAMLSPAAINASACRGPSNAIPGNLLNAMATVNHFSHHSQSAYVNSSKVFSTSSSISRKRQFDVASLLAPDHGHAIDENGAAASSCEIDEDIDVDDSGDRDYSVGDNCELARGPHSDSRLEEADVDKQSPMKCSRIQSNFNVPKSDYPGAGAKAPGNASPVTRQPLACGAGASPGLQQRLPWYGLIQQWPESTIDPRVLVERYYGQYMVAAAVAQQSHDHQSRYAATNDNNNNNSLSNNGSDSNPGSSSNNQMNNVTPSSSPHIISNSQTSSPPSAINSM